MTTFTLDTYNGPEFIHRTAVEAKTPIAALHAQGYRVRQFSNIKLTNSRLVGKFNDSTHSLVIEALH